MTPEAAADSSPDLTNDHKVHAKDNILAEVMFQLLNPKVERPPATFPWNQTDTTADLRAALKT